MARRILPDLSRRLVIDSDAPQRPDGDIAACEELLALLYKHHPEHAPKEPEHE